MSDPINWTLLESADNGILPLVLEESDKRIAAQIELMIAGDSRANGVLAICVTLAAGGVGVATAQMQSQRFDALFWVAAIFAIFEAIAALLALWSLWPEKVEPQGWSPSRLISDVEKGKKLEAIQSEIAKFNNDRIINNRDTARKLSFRIRSAMLILAGGPLIGASAGAWAEGFRAVSTVLFVLTLFVGIVFGRKITSGANGRTPSPSA